MLAERGTSLRRGLDILALLGSDAAGADGLGVTQIAALTGHEKSLVSRTLSLLAERGFAERLPGRPTYRLGWEFFALAGRAGEPRLIQEAAATLVRLVAELGEAAHLSVLRGPEVLTLLTQPAPHAIAASGWVGRTIPACCTSSGRALLLDHDRAALVNLLGSAPFPPSGPGAPADVDELHRRILQARAAGYAVADEESEPGLVAVAAPVRDVSGRIVAALNVSAPKFRLAERLGAAGAVVADAARDMSRTLGGPDDDHPPPRSRTADVGGGAGRTGVKAPAPRRPGQQPVQKAAR